MFKEIFLFDLKLNFRKPQTYIFFGLFFLMTFFLALLATGFLNTAQVDSNATLNSSLAVASIYNLFNSSILGLINSVILVAVMATAIQKDYEYNTHPLYFTKPITKGSYFFGRFLSAFITAAFVFSGQMIGYYLGCLPGAGTPVMGPFLLANFLNPFLIFVLPNIFLLGIIFVSITTFTRTTLPAYLFCIILLVMGFATSAITSNLDNKSIAAILEPFGSEALGYITQYWTPDDQNTRMIPFERELLYNRLLWLGIALVITAVSFVRFSFSQFLSPISFFKRKSKAEAPSNPSPWQTLATLPVVHQFFSAKDSLRQLFYLARFEFRKITRTTFFIIIALLGVTMMVIMAQVMGAIYETETYPVTYQMLEAPAGFFSLFVMILTIFLSGNIIWRDREQKIDELIGTTPVSNTVLLFSKYLGLVYVVATLMLVFSVSGMLIQMSKGFFDIDVLLYLKYSLRMLLSYSIIIGLFMAIHTFSPNKYLGFFLCLLPMLLSNLLFPRLEWNNNLYHFNSGGPSMSYSDMNGFGHVIGTWFLYKGYWLSIVLVLCLLALTFFARGKEKGLKARYRLSRTSFGPKHKLALAICLLCAFSAGAYIFYNTNILHKVTTPKQMQELSVAFEKTYKRYEKTPQLRIVVSSVDVDIFPKERKLNIKGSYYLKNKRSLPIDTLFINYIGGEKVDYHFSKLQPAVEATTLVNDQKFGVKIFRLQKPVQPGDSIRFDFEAVYKPEGFENDNTETSVVYNGTFFNSMMFPSIGYDANAELGENRARAKYHLPYKPRMARVNDSAARMNTYISNDADWIRFETTVSTSADQIAIAPGYLQKEWKKGDRRYFSYKMDSPILNFYSYLSADYQVRKDKWNDVNIEIFYQKGHEYNIDRMIKGIKKSLDYYTKNFGPYQHRQVRILEFPRYQSFAQSFPNTIPFSESIGFIAKVDDADNAKIDVPFYVTAHEVAHQWWAHQAIGGNVQGSVLMSETMSQYSALMVMEKEYGRQAMKKFLRHEMDDYLMGRTTEGKEEVPLMLCENQGYIHYNKGSVIMYSLRDYLGEDVLNAAIRKYLDKVKFQEPQYTNSIEFVNYLRDATPDSLKYIIKDMFETITIYENYVKDLSYEKMADGRYKVKLTLGSAKFRADEKGKSKKVPVADYIDVGIFAAKNQKGKIAEDKELVLQKIKMDKPEKTFEFIVNEKPVSAGIDPYNKLIDRRPDNNTWKFGSKPPKVDTDVKSSGSGDISIKVETD